MIFVTVGTDRAYGFDRLIKACDALAPALPLPVVMQIAATKYIPQKADYFRYVPVHEYWDYFQKAKLIISHCSSGPVMNAFRFQKPLIVMPRRSAFNEFADEHQLDFARSLEVKKMASIKVLYDERELKSGIHEMLCLKTSSEPKSEGLKNIILTIQNFIHANS